MFNLHLVLSAAQVKGIDYLENLPYFFLRDALRESNTSTMFQCHRLTLKLTLVLFTGWEHLNERK